MQRMFQRDSAGTRTMRDTAAAKPAFIRIQDDWRLAYIRIGNQDVGSTYLHTIQAGAAKIGVKQNRSAC